VRVREESLPHKGDDAGFAASGARMLGCQHSPPAHRTA
jgi:hypothetical protein